MFFRILICFCVIEFYGTQAKTEAEIKGWFLRQGIDCNIEHPISPEEMVKLEEHKLPDSKNAKCLVACIFRKTKMFDDKGMFDLESAIALGATNYPDEPAKQENSKKLMEMCKKVNDEAVSDGESGCERAVLLVKCFHDNAPALGIQLP